MDMETTSQGEWIRLYERLLTQYDLNKEADSACFDMWGYETVGVTLRRTDTEMEDWGNMVADVADPEQKNPRWGVMRRVWFNHTHTPYACNRRAS